MKLDLKVEASGNVLATPSDRVAIDLLNLPQWKYPEGQKPGLGLRANAEWRGAQIICPESPEASSPEGAVQAQEGVGYVKGYVLTFKWGGEVYGCFYPLTQYIESGPRDSWDESFVNADGTWEAYWSGYMIVARVANGRFVVRRLTSGIRGTAEGLLTIQSGRAVFTEGNRNALVAPDTSLSTVDVWEEANKQYNDGRYPGNITPDEIVWRDGEMEYRQGSKKLTKDAPKKGFVEIRKSKIRFIPENIPEGFSPSK